MSEANKLFEKLEQMPLEDLLGLCSLAIKSKMEKRRLEMMLLLLETRLQKYRMLSQMGMKSE